MPPRVVITETLDARCAAWLSQRADVVWARYDEPAAMAEHLPAADALVVRTYTQVDADLLDRAPKLKVVGRAGVVLENVDLAACRERGIRVVYTPDANTQAVVEYVLALMLDELRPRYTLEGPVDSHTFHALRKDQVGVQLDELTLGILGFGRIGKRLGAVASALGMTLLVNDLLPEADLRAQVGYDFQFVDKHTLFADSDILTIHVDGRASNRHLVHSDLLFQLRPGCLLINAARGMLVDPAALAAWARSDAVKQHGGKAVLDVHDPEPPDHHYPLFGLPNVRLLPHLASRTDTAMRNMSWVVKDVMTVLEGNEPRDAAV